MAVAKKTMAKMTHANAASPKDPASHWILHHIGSIPTNVLRPEVKYSPFPPDRKKKSPWILEARSGTSICFVKSTKAAPSVAPIATTMRLASRGDQKLDKYA